MKKMVSLLLLSLYASSFSGMLWASDCKPPEFLTINLSAADQPCNSADDHTPDEASHPFLKFCQLVKAHKEVLPSQPKQSLTPYSKALDNAYSIWLSGIYTQCLSTIVPLTPKSQKLFIQYRVLLI